MLCKICTEFHQIFRNSETNILMMMNKTNFIPFYIYYYNLSPDILFYFWTLGFSIPPIYYVIYPEFSSFSFQFAFLSHVYIAQITPFLNTPNHWTILKNIYHPLPPPLFTNSQILSPPFLFCYCVKSYHPSIDRFPTFGFVSILELWFSIAVLSANNGCGK